MLMLSSSDEPPTTFHLVRHGMHAEFGRLLSGRAGASPLSNEGRVQAAGLANWPGIGSLNVIHVSPRTRAVETAAIIAAGRGVDLLIVPDLDEVDFGEWNGLAFVEVESDPRWHEWNGCRSTSRAPGGEMTGAAVERAVHHMERFAAEQPGATLLCVTHCDIIRGVVAHYLGLSLDNLLRFEVDPGSITTMVIDPSGGRVIRLNEVPA